jgi:lambda repressor-like predicted transcriptional regulator
MAATVQPRGIDPGQITSQMMAQLIHAYMECSDTTQAVIREMAAIYNDPESDEDEKAMALTTIGEAVFPPNYGGSPGSEIDEADRHDAAFKAANVEMDAQEQRFADRLRAAMEAKGISQVALAEAVGINQSAVSNMLARKTRPQRRTVAKFAEALGIPAAELWPVGKSSIGT